ncbi:MAG: hypothetical protein EBZ88_05675 [Actinobacteria bacterium]|nr:hypothetical protein [Actinomycetota bacterium]
MGESASDRGNAPSDTGDATSATAGAPKVLMVRHGESEWNVLGKWQGRADIALTEAGREQARAAADYVRAVVAGERTDPVLSAHLKDGWRVVRPIHGYLQHDPESANWAAVIQWINPACPPPPDPPIT